MGPSWGNPEKWMTVLMGEWIRKEHINLLEARIGLHKVYRVTHSERAWEAHIFVFESSLLGKQTV